MNYSKVKAWPFKEAQKLQKRFREAPTSPVRFETGFGPSGLPHIGTFAEIARTTWVQNAFSTLTNWPTELIAFSDDMDGLRKVPLNIPQQEMLNEHLGKPLCHIPDPFEECGSYSEYMNNKLIEFLDTYKFNYKFQSSNEAYKRGDFNEGLSIILQKAEEIRGVILPTIGEDKRENWSPFFPICEKCGRINTTRVTGYHPEDDTVDYICDQAEGLVKCCNHKGSTSIHNGQVKVGWKVDWALRWYSYDISYEMYGKDLIDSAKLTSKIQRIMGKQPPSGYFYELFLDEDGKKISKSKGKGLTIDTWTKYAPLESLLYYLFQNPKQAKRLYWGVVPKSVDDYLTALKGYSALDTEKKPNSALWHVFDKGASVPDYKSSINFSLINNLISAVGTSDMELIAQYLKRYDSDTESIMDVLTDLVNKAMEYYQDYILPGKQYRTPTDNERNLFTNIHNLLKAYEGNSEDEIQSIPFNVAREFDIPVKELFKIFYEVVLGQERGPRFGTFSCLVGKDKVLSLLEEKFNIT